MSNPREIEIDLAARLVNVPPPWDWFSIRQLAYLSHLLAGHSYMEIASHYRVGESSVRTSIYRMSKSMQCSPRHVEHMAASEGIPRVELPRDRRAVTGVTHGA